MTNRFNPTVIPAGATLEERRAIGKQARKDVPRSSHAEWASAPDRPDPVALLADQATRRLAELVPLRHGRMLASAFTFYRGGAEIMAADLGGRPTSGLGAQLCGDAHLSNFGAFAAPDRRLVFDVNDFDETLPGPWEWDVKRLAASVEIGARDLGFGRKDRGRAVSATLREYRVEMRRLAELSNLDVWYLRIDHENIPELAGEALGAGERAIFESTVAKAKRKDRMRAFAKLTEVVDGRLRIVSQPPLIVPVEDLVPDEQAADIEDRARRLVATYAETLRPESAHLLESYRYVHLARKVVGVGSVGTRAWLALFVGRDEGDPLFLQIKEAERSALEPFAQPCGYEQQGERVVRGQRLMQATGDILLGWMRATGFDGQQRDFYVRQFWDAKGSARIDLMTPRHLTAYGRLCGATLARAHARSGDRIAIASYLGAGQVFDDAVTRFAELYADQNERDFAAVTEAVREGRLEAEQEAPG